MNIEIKKKPIKNMYLRVTPPNGDIVITAPVHMPEASIQKFLAEKEIWIRKQQVEIRRRAALQNVQYITGEVLSVWGNPHALVVHEENAHFPRREKVVGVENEIHLYIPVGSSFEDRKKMIVEWYRQEIKKVLPYVVKNAEYLVGKQCSEWQVKKMKTKWGTCNTVTGRIWLNLQLATKPIECLEYVVIHELVHLYERNHNRRFYALMDQFLPDWRVLKGKLNEGAMTI